MATESIKKAIFANVVDNKAIVIAGINERTKLRLLGATTPTSVPLTREYESEKTVILYPNQGEDGLIAITIYSFDGWTGGKYNQERSICFSAFLKVTWESNGDAPRIDLDNPWFPADRIGTIRHQDYVDSLEVAIKERRFSSLNLSRSHRERHAEDATTYDLDGNLLCRYLWGTVSEEELLARIEAPKMLEEGLAEILRDRRSLQESCERRAAAIAGLTNDVNTLMEEVCYQRGEVRRLEARNEFVEERRETAVEWSMELLYSLVDMVPLYETLSKLPRWRRRPAGTTEFIAAMKAAKFF